VLKQRPRAQREQAPAVHQCCSRRHSAAPRRVQRRFVHATPPHQELGSTSGFRTYMAPDRNHVSTTSAERADGHRGTRCVQGVHWTGLKLLSSARVRQGCNTSTGL
jgi:hypothetical protein